MHGVCMSLPSDSVSVCTRVSAIYLGTDITFTADFTLPYVCAISGGSVCWVLRVHYNLAPSFRTSLCECDLIYKDVSGGGSLPLSI